MFDNTYRDLIASLIDAAWQAIESHAEELTALDQAIGDGDHGLNMKRGFAAIVEARDAPVVHAGHAAVCVGVTVAALWLTVDDVAGVVAAEAGIEEAWVLVDLPVAQPAEGAR